MPTFTTPFGKGHQPTFTTVLREHKSRDEDIDDSGIGMGLMDDSLDGPLAKFDVHAAYQGRAALGGAH